MKCAYCHTPAGWFKKICPACQRLLQLYREHRGRLSLIQLLDLFIETGLAREQIETFLRADPHGEGSVRDQVTAEMSSALLGAMGISQRQTAADVKRLRDKGEWTSMGRRPRE